MKWSVFRIAGMPNWAKIACSLRMTSVAVSFVAVSVSSKDVYRRVLRIVVHDDHGILAIGELAKSIDTSVQGDSGSSSTGWGSRWC